MAVTPNLPTPQSYEQILSDMLSSYAASLGINDFNVGSLNLSFFEVVALATARASGDLFQILRDFSVDRASGDSLQLLAQEYGVTPVSASPATGNVSVIDTSFTEILTKIYAGTNPPNIGSVTINVSDASQFPASGSVYIGRGTPNVEGPLPYSSVAQSGSFWIITLTNPTTKFHNLGETVILAQGGNRTVPANTIVLSPGVGSSPDIQYSVVTSAIILDGETEVDNVQVTALTPGSSGNVPAGAIKTFANPPFIGATVSNPLPFTTGTDSATDDQIRVQIKAALASQGLGTGTAIQSALFGATATEPNGQSDTIVNTSIVINTDGTATVYIDDGTGYEETSQGVGLESIVDSAIGGEQFFQLQTGGTQAPVAKAYLQTTLTAPFNIVGGDALAVVVGGVTYQHVFANSDFISPGAATSYEITASINADATLGFEATTASNGAFVVIKAKAETDDSLFVTTPTVGTGNASPLLGFPANTVETLRLYKNNIPLSKDGSTASVFTQNQELWSPTIQNGDTLILSVDGTAPITFTLTNADFIATGLYTTVSATNSLASWVQVFNNVLTGVTASIVGQQIEITSNLGASSRASVVINQSSTLVSKGMFSSVLGLSSSGKSSDFTLDRNTAQFELVVPLSAGDKLSAGSSQTEAFIKSADISGGSVVLTSSGNFWLLIDTPGQIIQTGVVSNTLLSVSTPNGASAPYLIRYTSNVSGAFGNVLPGDYIIVWSAELPSGDTLEGRVYAVTSTTLDVQITQAELALVTPTAGVNFQQGFVILRSALAPQRFEIPSGTSTLDQIATLLSQQTDNLTFSVFEEQNLIITTNTLDTTGSLLVVTADGQGQLLQLPVGTFAQSQTSLIAFYDSQETTGDLPLFLHAPFAAGVYADPPDSFVTSVTSSVSLSAFDPNDLICMLHPYGSIRDAQPYGECVQETAITGGGTTIGLVEDSYVHRVRNIDRFYLANPVDFGHQDIAVVILDNNAPNESFTIPFYRRAITNTGVSSNPFNFNAYDVDSGPTANFQSAFPNFNFANFKALMQAKKVLLGLPAGNQTAILYRATQWGRSGEKINVGYIYPSGPNQSISSSIQVGANVSILIILASGATSPNAVDASTQWNVTITPNTPSAGIDQVTYTWNGSGTNPNLSLSGGEYVNITTQSAFNVANTGVFRVSTQSGFTPTSTSFSVQRPTGVAVAQNNVLTLVNGAMSFYVPSPTTAAQIAAYVNSVLPLYMSATLTNDGGMTGSGVIVLSTYEFSGFTYSTVSLLDGINWLASSNVSGTPQFVFKNALALPTDVGYAFNNGEQVRFIPTTMDQINRLISVLAVTGFTTDGSVSLVDRDSRLELATQTLGSSGAIQVVGGTANEYTVPVLQSALNINNSLMEISVNSIAGQGIHSDQWFRLQALSAQAKIAGLSSNSGVTVISNTPSAGEATVNLLGRTLTQRYFGKPRNHVRTKGNTFRVEKQGNLVCISWTGVGTNPIFVKSPLNFNDSGGGTINVSLVNGTSDAQYLILTGNANFTELSIGDLITISGLPKAANNGTFLVTGVSDNGKTLQVTNPNASNELSSGTFTFTGNANAGDQFTIGATTLTAGTYASFTGMVSGMSTNVTITANNVGTIGNSVTLSFNGTTTINSAITNWNSANPTNMITLSSGDGTQVPSNSTSISLSGGQNGNFGIGPSSIITASNLAATIGNIPNVVASANGNIVTVTAIIVAANIAISYTPFSTTEVTVSGSHLVGDSFDAGDFVASSGVSEGDTIILSSPFSILNQGRFRVIREYNNSIWIENPNVVEEEVSLPYNAVNLGFDATTSFQVNASNNSLHLEWTGVGTEPTLGNANVGDIIIVGTDFASQNQGSFMVLDSSVKLQQITQITLPSGSQFAIGGAGTYFETYNAGNLNSYYVWFNVNGSNSDPAPGGFTGIMVAILSGDTAISVASKTALAINGSAIGLTAVASGATVTLTTSGFVETNSTVNVNVPAPFAVQTLQFGTRTYLDAINPSAVNQSSVLVTTNILQDHRPQIQFWEYEAAVPGDIFVSTGSTLTTANAGSFVIAQVLNRNSAIVTGNMASVTNVSLNNNITGVFIQEGVIYNGYKQVYLVSPQPGAPTQNLVVFNTNAQSQKINQSAGVALTSLSKLNFNTALTTGLDSYRFNTGLIAEANRIIYGDPRDPITYPGVGAAGADIFVQAPLTLRIQVSVDVRLLTGAPFNTISQQVRTNIAYLINSNPVGQSIDISSIISTVRSIPGVSSVAISSPQYSPTSDLIQVEPSEKARIIDPTTDISVSQIGS